MIVEAVMTLLLSLLTMIFLGVSVESLPSGVASMIISLTSLISQGIGIIKTYIHADFIFGLFSVIVSLEAVTQVYRFCTWFLKKLPFTHIS